MMLTSPQREFYQSQTAAMRLTAEEKSRFDDPLARIYSALPAVFKDVFVKIPGTKYYMMKTEITNTQWVEVMGGTTPSQSGFDGSDQPVVNVSWNDAKGFIEKCNAKLPAGFRLRLPTETEWENAARSGTTTERYWEDDANKACTYANIDDGSHNCQDGYVKTAPVGKFQPNAYGLHDMIGNVWEWTEDGAADGTEAMRSGSWRDKPGNARAAARIISGAGFRSDNVGFRCVLAPQEL